MRRIVPLLLAAVLLLNMCACGNGAKQVSVAVEINSDSELAAQELVREGISLVTYSIAADVVFAVENGKAQKGVLDEFKLAEFLRAGRSVISDGKC